jgi:uncharacterized coiled-coil DUF342 family protein
MIEAAIISIIPPLVAAVLTYVIASRRSKIQQAKILSEMQGKAIETVAAAEAKMRAELWAELDVLRIENHSLRDKISAIELQNRTYEQLNITMKEEIVALKTTVDAYKEQNTQNRNRIEELTHELNSRRGDELE